MKKSIIHINQHRIKANCRNGTNDPVITVKSYNSNDYGHEVVIYDKEGNEIARVVYRKDNPLSCGAHCWIETRNPIKVITNDGRNCSL